MHKEEEERIHYLAEEIYNCRLSIDRAIEEIDAIGKKSKVKERKKKVFGR